MVKIYPNSRIEIWSINYINNPEQRLESDLKKEVIQIEATNDSKNFLVEVVEEE